MGETAAGTIQQEHRAEVGADIRHLLVEVLRNSRRQGAAGHHDRRGRRCPAQLQQAIGLFGQGQLRPGQYEPVLPLGAELIDGEALPGGPADGDAMSGESLGHQELVHQFTGRAAGREHRGRCGAEHLRDMRDVDTAAARVVARSSAPQLVRGAHHLGAGGDVQGRVHTERDDAVSGDGAHRRESKLSIPFLPRLTNRSDRFPGSAPPPTHCSAPAA